MSSKSLKFKIKKKWELINNEKAKILALLEEIRFDAESRIKEVEKTVTTALGQTNKTKFTDCLGDLERVHQQLCIISEKLEDKESGESQEESDAEENDTVNGSLKVITEEDKSEVPSDVTDDTEKKRATAALQDIQEKCTPEDDCSGVDEAQNAEKAAQLLTESNLTDDADFTERCNSPAPTGVTSLHSSTTDTSFASASQSFHSSTKSSKLNWGEPSWKPVAKQVMGPVALQVPQAQYLFVEQNSIPYPAVSTTYSGYSVPQYNTAQLNKQQPGVQTNLVTSQFQLSNAQYLPQYANHAVGPTPSAFQPTNNFGTYPNCPPPASYTSFRPQPNHSDAINPIATNKDATLTKADDGGFKVPLPVNSQQDGPRKTDQYRPVEVNSIYGSVRATSSSSRLTESSAVTAPTSLPSQKQKRMLRGKKKPSSVSSQPEMSIPSDYGFGPRLSSLRLKDGSVMNVSVIDIASPTFFWVRLESKTIEDFAERMSYYYTQTPVECLKIPQPIKVGMLVCSTYNDDGEFYRARVIGMKHADGGVPERFKVLYIDYGNQSWVYRKDIMAIPEGFCEVPPYAVPCTLSQVGPLKGGFDWSEEARQTMYELLKDKDSTKVKVNVVADCPLAFVDLFVRSEPSDSQMNLADELKRLKLACSVQNVHVANYFRNNAREDNNTESCLQLTTVIAMHSGVVKSIKPSDIELRNNESVSLFPPKATEPVNERVFNWINEQQQITLQPQEDSAEKSSSKDRNTQPRVLTDVAKRMVDHAMNSTGRANQKTGAKPNHSKLSDLDASSKSNDFTEVERYEGESLLRNSSTASESEKMLISENAFLSGEGTSTRLLKPEAELKVDNGVFYLLMAHIENPSEFYVHQPSIKSSVSVDKMTFSVKKFFNRYSEEELRDLSKSLKVFIGMHCIALYSDKNLYRCRVLDFSVGSDKEKTAIQCVHVHYVDFGNKHWVSRRSIFPLPTEFAGEPPQAICCKLSGVEPFPNDDGLWSSEATEKFRELTGGVDNVRQLLGVVEEHESSTGIFRSHPESPLSVYVLDSKDDIIPKVNNINDELVQHKLAHSRNFPPLIDTKGGGDNASKEETEKWEEWYPMEQDYYDPRNSTAVDTDDAQVAVMQYTANDESRICKYFATGRQCWSGDSCQFEHVRRDEHLKTTDKMAILNPYDTECAILTPSVGDWFVVEVTVMYSPMRFYVCFPYGPKTVHELWNDDGTGVIEGYDGSTYSEEKFEEFQGRMNDHYNRLIFRDHDLTLYGLGEIVAVKSSMDKNWYRAKIVESEPEIDKHEVFYVDFGNTECVEGSQIRQIQYEFLYLPFQCVECSLPVVSTQPGYKWSQDAKDRFLQLTNGSILFAEIIEGSSSLLIVKLYNTEQGKEICIDDDLVRNGFAKPYFYSDTTSSTNSNSVESKSAQRIVPR